MRRLFLWLLVLFLPLIGLADGLWLMPSDGTRWKVMFEGLDVVRGLGFADKRKIMLLAEKSGKIPAGVPRSGYDDVFSELSSALIVRQVSNCSVRTCRKECCKMH